ncbi:MAG: repressor LexA, partial [Verrucomicrobia bacterium]|nr:repressor LexA [Verrucomicrobiota bacterium]
MEALTESQRGVFEFVRSTLAEGAPAPTVREIAAHFSWSSKRAAACHLEAIIAKGWLTSDPGKARSLRLAGPGRRGAPA